MTHASLIVLCVMMCWIVLASAPAMAQNYRNFKVAVYMVANTTREMADPQRLEQQWGRINSQVKIDKVYIETYRSRRAVDEATIEPVKKFFTDKGVAVAGGITLTANDSGQFETFSYANPEHRAEVKAIVEMTAKHFDEVILDDFFFYCTKTDADIAAKGSRTWTQYRLEAMREASENLVIKPAKAINPKVKVVIKYPNWYEHFQGTGYDLDVQAKMFDAIYTGTETRDPTNTDQHLQQYESYLVYRYFDNIKPGGGNLGGWVDTFSTGYVDRYAEQLWNTMFAKAPEITLFNWVPMASQRAQAGERAAWAETKTSFDWDQIVKGAQPEPTWALAAGESLRQVDAFLHKLGKPIGIASYKPYQSTGEDFLHNYLGMIGIPIELYPTFPTEPSMVLLTESAKADPQIVARIKTQLQAGKNVTITSGLLRALQGRGIEEIIELEYTDRKVAIQDFLGSWGAGGGTLLDDDSKSPNQPVLIPQIQYLTNDAWQLLRGVTNGRGYPLLLMNRYSKGVLFVLTIPENFNDLYNFPPRALGAIRMHLLREFPVNIEARSHVALFAYDNNTFIVQSYLHEPTQATVSLAKNPAKLRNLVTDELIEGRQPPAPTGRGQRRGAPGEPQRLVFTLDLQPHSFIVLGAE